MARLKPGISASQATAAANTIFVSAATSGPMAIFKPTDSPHLELPTAAYGLASLRNHFFRPLFMLLTAVAIVLLVACANIAGLMLARSASRRREIATRSALGASRARIIQQLLTESILLSVAGGGAGIILGYWRANIMAKFLSANWYYPLQVDVHPDSHVLRFALLVSVLVGLLFGLAPAFSSGRLDLVTALKEAGASSTGASRGHWFSLGNALVIVQMTLSMLVLAGAGLLVRTLANLRGVNIGFEAKNVLLFNVGATYSDRTEESLRTLGRDLQDQLVAVPGVSSASYSSFALLRGTGISAGAKIDRVTPRERRDAAE